MERHTGKQQLGNSDRCPVEITLRLISEKWKVLIIRCLLTRTYRYLELKRSVPGITQKVLTQSLRSMEECGLIHREIYKEIPPKVEYSLTPLGRSLEPILLSMQDWGEEYKKQKGIM
jgi:DNA-binding HxlR family transcriptional regulator